MATRCCDQPRTSISIGHTPRCRLRSKILRDGSSSFKIESGALLFCPASFGVRLFNVRTRWSDIWPRRYPHPTPAGARFRFRNRCRPRHGAAHSRHDQASKTRSALQRDGSSTAEAARHGAAARVSPRRSRRSRRRPCLCAGFRSQGSRRIQPQTRRRTTTRSPLRQILWMIVRHRPSPDPDPGPT